MPKKESPKPTDDQPNLSSTALFVGLSIILILVAFIFTIGGAVKTTTISFGDCQLKTEVALTSQQQAKGLSGRTEIDKDKAMIFPFNHDQPAFWMKDMLFPIDIVWVASNKVVKIDAEVPADDGATNYLAEVPIDWVIEVANGRAQACGVETGTDIKGLRT